MAVTANSANEPLAVHHEPRKFLEVSQRRPLRGKFMPSSTGSDGQPAKLRESRPQRYNSGRRHGGQWNAGMRPCRQAIREHINIDKRISSKAWRFFKVYRILLKFHGCHHDINPCCFVITCHGQTQGPTDFKSEALALTWPPAPR